MKNTIRITVKDDSKGKITRSLLVDHWVKSDDGNMLEEYIISTDIGKIRELSEAGYHFAETLIVKATISINNFIKNAEITLVDNEE